MKAYLEIVKIDVADIVTVSGGGTCAPVTICEDEI